MRPKSIMLLALALGCGLVAAIGIRQIVAKNGQAGGEVDTTPIFVAMTEIRYSDKIIIGGEDANVKLEAWPTANVPEGAIVDRDVIKDRQAGALIPKGAAIFESFLIGEGDGAGVSARIPPGYRAYTIKGTSDTALGNLLRPQNRVDVLVYVEKKNLEKLGFPGIPTQTMMILANIKVLAINDQSNREKVEEAETSVSIKSVTLLLAEKQAVRLAFSAELGKLRLILRGVSENQADGLSDNDPTMGTIDKFADIFLGDANKEKGAPAKANLTGPLPSSVQPSIDPVVEAKPEGPKNFQVVILQGPNVTVWEHNPQTKRMRRIEGAAHTGAVTTGAQPAAANGTGIASGANAGLPQCEVDLTELVDEAGDK